MLNNLLSSKFQPRNMLHPCLPIHYACMVDLQVGDKVTKGQVLCIVEAMKLMNEIEVRYDLFVAKEKWFLDFHQVISSYSSCRKDLDVLHGSIFPPLQFFTYCSCHLFIWVNTWEMLCFLGGCLEWGLFGCLRMCSSWISLYGLYFHQADQSGTIMDILADDGKPVSIETVCLLSFIFCKLLLWC